MSSISMDKYYISWRSKIKIEKPKHILSSTSKAVRLVGITGYCTFDAFCRLPKSE